MNKWIKPVFWTLLAVGFFTLLAFGAPRTSVRAQQPTGSIATVTGTATGPYVTVIDPDGANVRSGPGSYDYPIAIGWLQPGESAWAIGRSPGQEWIQIIYVGTAEGVGWVYAPLVSLSPGYLPIVEPPPTATPRTTATLDPTMVAQFGIQLTPTRMPTFTAPAPIEYPTFDNGSASGSRVPAGFLILGLAIVGVLGAVFSFLRSR